MSWTELPVDPNPQQHLCAADNLYTWAPEVVYEPSHPLMRALFEACNAHDLPAVEALVDSWHQNQSSSGHPTLLIGALEPVFHHAVRLDDAPITSFLLDAGISIDRMTIMEATDVQVQFGKSFLITGGTSVYRWNKSDHLHSRICPPYPTSASDVLDNPELLTWFLAHGASPNAASQIGRTPFMAAVAHAPLETVQLLRAHGADAGNTLPSAARSKTPGRLEVVCLLLDTGAPIDAVEYEHNALGFSSDFNLGPAVDLAVCYNSDEMVELLLERGARMEIVDYFEGRSVLQLATDFGSPRKGGMQMDLARGSPGETAEEA